MLFTLQTELARPAADAWRAFEDPANLPIWQPSLVAFEPLSGPPGHPGSTARLTFHEKGLTVVLVQTVTLRRPPEEFAAVFDSTQAKSTVYNSFVDLAGGRTRWRVEMEFELKGLLRVLGGTIRGTVERRLHQDTDRFRAALEGGAFDRPAPGGAS